MTISTNTRSFSNMKRGSLKKTKRGSVKIMKRGSVRNMKHRNLVAIEKCLFAIEKSIRN